MKSLASALCRSKLRTHDPLWWFELQCFALIRQDILNVCGSWVYCFVEEERIVYIGITGHLGSRISTHKSAGDKLGSETEIYVFNFHGGAATREQLEEFEGEMIRQFQPERNCAKRGLGVRRLKY